MKTLNLVFAFLILIAAPETKDKQLTITKEKVEFVITEKTKEPQLKKFAKILKEEANIDFTFKDIIVNSKGNLSKLFIEVNSNDGVKASGTLLIGNIYEVGFVRDYQITKDGPAEKQLIIGNLREKEVILK